MRAIGRVEPEKGESGRDCGCPMERIVKKIILLAFLGIYYIIEDVDEAFNFNTTERRISHMNQVIYLDNAATTRTRPEVVEAMVPYFSEHYGNPSSVYEFSSPCKEAIDHAREAIAESLEIGRASCRERV